MGKAAVWGLLFSISAMAQTAGTTFFRAVLLPNNEVPAVNVAARGTADVVVNAITDQSGQIASGTIDILTRVNFTAGATAMGLGIWSGAAGQNGARVVNTNLSIGNQRVLLAGGDVVHLTVQVAADDQVLLPVLRNLYQNNGSFYVNLATTAFPNGAIRGQLQRAQGTVLMALMSSDNVVTTPTAQAHGVAQVVAIGTRDASGNWTSGEAYFSASYYSEDLTPFTVFDIHPGAAGVASSQALAAVMPPTVTPDPTGSGGIGAFNTEVTITTPLQVAALGGMFGSPSSWYIDMHTSGNPAGLMRGQLRPTEQIVFPLTLASGNETAVPGVPAAAMLNLTLYALRNEDGSLAAGTFLTDMDYRLDGPTQFIGLYLRRAPQGQDGPVAMRLAPDFYSDSWMGSYYNWSPPNVDGATIEELLKNPENYYLNLHTLSQPAGAARGQLAASVTAPPAIAAAISINLDKAATTLAPGELFTIFGSNLAKASASLGGWSGQTLPVSLNGSAVHVGGRDAPLLYVSPGQINAQIPIDLAPGIYSVTAGNANGVSTALTVNVAATAPAIFFYPVAAVLKNADYSLVSSSNPAKAGDALVVYATGLGTTNPPVPPGQLVPDGVLANTATVTASIGGKPATVIYSIATSHSIGLYQVAVTVPAGVTGTVPLTLQQGGVASNTVNISVK
jgi:uncharacterized protein (TIGR03437 family)